MRFVGGLLLVSMLISISAPTAADACGCQKKALQNMIKLQQEAVRLHLPSQSLRDKAKLLNASGKLAEAQTTFDEAAATAIGELKAAETDFKKDKGLWDHYHFALLHAAEIQKERGRLMDQRHNPLAWQMYEQALNLEQQAGLSPEDSEFTSQTLVTMMMQAHEYTKAEPYAQQLLMYRQSVAGNRYSPQVAQSLENYAVILKKLGRADEAKQYEQQSRAIAAGYEYMQ